MHHVLTQLAAGEWTLLLSPWKPVLMALTFLPWAWLISTKLDKDAMYFHLNRIGWNAAYLAAGGVAALAMIFTPIFYIGWPVGIIILLAPILAYWKIRNAQVPEEKVFKLSSESLRQRLEARSQAKAHRGALVSFVGPNGELPIPDKESPVFAAHLLAEDLLGPAADARASKVEAQPGKNGYLVIQTVDGFKYRRDPVQVENANHLIDYLKEAAGLDVQNRRRRQVGTLKMRSPNGDTVLTITTAGSSAGQELRIEFDRADRLNVPFDNLGLLEPQLNALKRLDESEHRHGIVLIGAPPGHGLSTMGYSMVGRHDAYTTNVKTLEREIMFRHDGVDHTEWDPNNPDVDFATQLQSILRRDPDVVLVTDIIEPNAAHIAATNTNLRDGTLIYIPQRLPGVKEQIVDWVKRVGDIKTAVRPLHCVVNGRLVRTLCPSCRQPYRPTPEQLRKLHLPADGVQQLFKASGKVQVKNKIENCPVCRGTGYFGQTGVFEVMMLDDTARKLIANNDLPGAYTHCRRHKMIFLQEAALKKVVEGMTTLEEINRAINPTQASPRPQPQPAGAPS